MPVRAQPAAKVTAIVLVVALALSLSACSRLSTTARTAVDRALHTAQAYGDDVRATLRRGSSTDANALQKSLGKVTTEGMSSAEAKVVKDGRAAAAYVEQFWAVTGLADNFLSRIPGEAKELVTTSLMVNSLGHKASPQLQQHLGALADEALKSAVCGTANDLLSIVDQRSVSTESKAYDTTIAPTVDSIADFLSLNIVALGYDVRIAGTVFDKVKFAGNALRKASAWASEIEGVITAPNVETARAHIFYIKACLNKF